MLEVEPPISVAYGHNWPKRPRDQKQAYINISKTKRNRATVRPTIKRKQEVIGCLSFGVLVSAGNHRKGPKWPSVGAYRFAAIGAILVVMHALK